MTYSEDVKRTSSPDTIVYLNARVIALENKVRELETEIRINNLNKKQ